MKQTERRKTQSDMKHKMKKWIFCFAAFSIISMGTLAFGGQMVQKEKIYYQSVIIHRGDTLWDIAKKYKNETETIEHMIDKIMECNQMRSANIKAGHRILVPVTIF